MIRCEPLPFSGVQIQISSFCFLLLVSQSAGKGPVRAPIHHSTCLFPLLSLAVFLSLSSSSSSPLLIALLILSLTSDDEREREREWGGDSTNFLNPIDLLHQTFHWEFTLVQKSLKKRCFLIFSLVVFLKTPLFFSIQL